ncbi:integrator complex subunit 4 [Procambarus clarkii]|uniref:integrator complex subunit 4 n=1 Tax=Procambarus clarkii TaxID=6728 RepID=UPI001E6740C1|nr:integrator complex subunit 4-like [Procambarus clarkii]
MAALLKKRALAEYCQTIVEEAPKPAKRLQLVRRTRTVDHNEFNVSSLDTTDAQQLLPSLVNLHHSLPISGEAQSEAVEGLMKLVPNDSLSPIITTKVLALLANIITTHAQAQPVFEEILSVTRRSKSQKVIAQGVNTACALSQCIPQDPKLQDQVIQLALSQFSSSSFIIKVRSLEAVGSLCPVEAGRVQSAIMTTLIEHTSHQDNRVRTAAFNSLLVVQEKGVKLPPDVYDSACQALTDDYQCVREAALLLVKVAADSDPERLVPIPDSDHHVRLIDNAFSQICNVVNDISVRVRTQAASLLGTMTNVSERFLQQTLDKKLMSNMRRKRSAHERARAMVSSGEWSSGKRWADDGPKEHMEADSVSVINTGSCGAFVHGLEDEFLEVRNAALDSLCALALNNEYFANQSLDFLVDMFNDEIEEVRLKAIQVLQQVAAHIILRADQLEEILHALKDTSLEIRECLHTFLGTTILSTIACVKLCVTGLLDNLRRYQQDRRSIHRCLRRLGSNHPILVQALVPQLLVIHPYFDGVEPSVQDGEYICKLILVLNAAVHCPTILPLLEQHTLRHYAYLRDTMPQLVPVLKLGEEWQPRGETVPTNTLRFLRESMEKVAYLDRSSTQLRLTVYQTVHSDLVKLADIDPALSPAAHFAALYTQCMLLFSKILSTRNWLTPSSLSMQQSGALKSNVDQLLKNTFRLRHAFTNLSPAEEASIRNLRVRTLALQLVYVVHGSTGSALGLCDNFLEHTEALHKYLTDEKLSADSFLEAVFEELSQLEEPRPGAVARILQPLLLTHPVPALAPILNPAQVHMCSAEIIEPQSDSDAIHKLSAGLVVGVPLDAEISHIPDPSTLRIRVAYPDHSTHLVVPPKSHLRLVSPGTYRLLTTVLVSAQVSWSEACHVGLSLVLDLSDQEVLAARRHCVVKTDDSATIIQLVKPVKVLVWPKAIRKGI